MTRLVLNRLHASEKPPLSLPYFSRLNTGKGVGRRHRQRSHVQETWGKQRTQPPQHTCTPVCAHAHTHTHTHTHTLRATCCHPLSGFGFPSVERDLGWETDTHLAPGWLSPPRPAVTTVVIAELPLA